MLDGIIKGSGKPVVLIHAFPLSNQMWQEQINLLAANAQVIAPDLPGLGRSAKESATSIAEMAQKIIAYLDYHKITEPAFMAGLSMGGYTLFEILRQFPKRIKAMGLFATRAAADTAEVREKRMQTIKLITQEGFGAYVPKILNNLLGATTLEQNKKLPEKVAQMIKGNSAEGVVNALMAMANRRDSTDLLNKINCPVLMIFGDEDKFVPAAEAEYFHKQIPSAEFHLLPKTGHMVNLENASAFNRILKNFISEIS